MDGFLRLEKFFFDKKKSFSEDNCFDMSVLGGEFDNDGYEHSRIAENEIQLMADYRMKETVNSQFEGKLLCLDVTVEVETCTINGQLKKHFECTRKRTNDVLKDVFGCELKLVEDVDPGIQEDTSSICSSNGRWERGTATNCTTNISQGSGSVDSSAISNSPNNFNVIIRSLRGDGESSRKSGSHYNDGAPANEWTVRQQKQSASKDRSRMVDNQSLLSKAKEFVLNNYHYGPFYENEFVFPDGSLIAYCLNGLIWKFGLDITLGSELKVFVRSGSSLEDKSMGKQKYEQFRECMKTFHRMEKERIAVQQSATLKMGGAVSGKGAAATELNAQLAGAVTANDEHQFKFSDESCKHELYNEILAKYNIPKRFYVPELRHIILDVSNIAETHGSQEPKKFSWLGVKIAYDHFRSSGHRHITLIVPHFKRHKTTDAEDLKIIRLFEDHDVIKYTQSRVPQASVHDDRMMLELAEKVGGVIVSNDKFSDVARDKAEWKRISRDFVCTFIFVKDVFILAPDPQGRQGDRLPRVLRKFEPNEYCCGTASLFCKFGEVCNYGKKCRYMHRTVKENKRIRSKRMLLACSGSSVSIGSQVSQPQTHLHHQSVEVANVSHQQYGRGDNQNPTAIRVVHENIVNGADQSAMQSAAPRHHSSLHPAMGGQGSFSAVANSPVPRHFTSQHSVSSNESGDAFVLTSNQRTASLNSSFSNLSYGGSQHSDDSKSLQSNTTSSSFAMHPTIYEQGVGEGGDYSDINSSASSADLHSQQFQGHAYYHGEMDVSNLSDTSSLASTTSSYFAPPMMNNPNLNDVRRPSNYEMYGYYQQQQQPEVTQRRHTAPTERQNSNGRRVFDDYANEFETVNNERRESVNGGVTPCLGTSNVGVASHCGFGVATISNVAAKSMPQKGPDTQIMMKEPTQRNAVGRTLHAQENFGGQGTVCSAFSPVNRETDIMGSVKRNTVTIEAVHNSANYAENEKPVSQHPIIVPKKEFLASSLEAECKKEVASQMNRENEKLFQDTVDKAATNISLVALIYPLEFCLLANQANPNLSVENKQLFCAKVAQLFCENDTSENYLSKAENQMFKANAADSKSSQILSKLNETNTMIYHLTKLLPQASMESILSSFPEIISPQQLVRTSELPDFTTMPSCSATVAKNTTSSQNLAAKIARDHLRRLLFQ